MKTRKSLFIVLAHLKSYNFKNGGSKITHLSKHFENELPIFEGFKTATQHNCKFKDTLKGMPISNPKIIELLWNIGTKTQINLLWKSSLKCLQSWTLKVSSQWLFKNILGFNLQLCFNASLRIQRFNADWNSLNIQWCKTLAICRTLNVLREWLQNF